MNRRSFLTAAAATSAGATIPFNILKAGPSPNSKLNIAVIGAGQQGLANARSLEDTDNIIAFCDVDEPWHTKCLNSKKYASLRGTRLWTDYRVMFDKIGNEIDAVCIATPEHAHYTISMYAMQRGKHVYCQKPLCHTVNEVRSLTEEARKRKVVTQMGHQGHSSQSSVNIRDWVQDGSIGKVREVIAYSRKGYYSPTPPSKDEVPPGFNWDLFLNRAEEIPFSESYRNRNWIKYRHFSGTVGDMGAHTLDAGYYALDLKTPISVRAEVAAPASPWSMPKGGVVTWEFPARCEMPPVTMKYYYGQGIQFPFPKHLEKERRAIRDGSVIVGESASVMAGSHSQSSRIIPEVKMKEVGRPSGKTLRCKGQGHFQNFSLACKGEDTAMSSFDYAGPLSEIIVLGDIALLFPGETLQWDSENMKITNHEAADKCMFMRWANPRDDKGWI